MTVGYARWRELGSGHLHQGATLGLVRSISTVRGHAAATLRREIELTVLTGPTVALGLARHEVVGSLDFGYVRVGAGAGLLPVSLDVVGRDFSLAVLCPRALAWLDFPLRRMRVSLVASTEYYWRVWGRADSLVQTLSIALARVQPRTLKRGRHPLIVRE